MTAVATVRSAALRSRRRLRRPARGERAAATGPVPPLSPRLRAIRATLVLVSALAVGLLLELTVVSSLQHAAAQGRAFDDLREQLAKGTAPIGPTDDDRRALALGTPVALLEIPSLDLVQVVGEGTTSGVLMDGPGHRRDTPLPGQVGTSVVMGRRAAFGGPFSSIHTLERGAEIVVTTGQGVFTFEVIGVRPERAPVPPPPTPGTARLLLATASGRSFVPDGVLRVDADLVDGSAVGGAPRVVSTAGLPESERFLAGDTGTLWALALWLQALIALSVCAVWSWHRWGRAQTWVVLLPPIVLVGLATAGEITRLLPNLL